MIAGALALLIFCVRAASAQDASATSPASPTQPYGFVPVQNAAPDTQPYGIKPIPGYTPPSPPQQLRGAYEGVPAPVAGQPDSTYGYVPLRPSAPAALPVAQQPQLRGNDAREAGSSPPNGAVQAVYQPPYGGSRADDYRLGPGDKIRVSVFGESDLSGEYQVDGSGMVRLPLIGTLRATGNTAPSLEQGIAGALADGYLKDPRVNVEIATYRPFYIIGAVGRPGQYAYVDNMNALNAVAVAGGFTEQAIQSTLYVRHEGDVTEQPVRTNQLSRIQPGDVIRVKTSLFWDAMNMFAPVAGPAAIAAAALH